jgi:DNA-binding NarL/FixJ family response regulator
VPLGVRSTSGSSPPDSVPQLLLLADPLLRHGLASLLSGEPSGYRVALTAEALQGAPQLILWCLAAPLPAPEALLTEVQHLQERWQPAPILLTLPAGATDRREQWLALPVQGLLQDPDPDALLEAITTLLAGGRVVHLAASGSAAAAPPSSAPVLGLGQWLLLSGLQQIDADLALCAHLLDPPPQSLLQQLLLEGRQRELRVARQLLLWIWAPAQLAWSQEIPELPSPPAEASGTALTRRSSTSLTLRQRDASSVWQAIRARLQETCRAELANRSGLLLALEGLSPSRREDLLLALLEQFDRLRLRLMQDNQRGVTLQDSWRAWQAELRREALRCMAGTYVQLPCDGSLRPVADTLLASAALTDDDPELPDPQPMLISLVQAQPVMVDGRLLAPDEPLALLHLELLVSNWLVRSAELICLDVLACCGAWPELRRYLLRPELLSTRNLERLRNRLSAQQRWSEWFERPVLLYESRRQLFRLDQGAIETLALTEPRDQELRRLGWWQQLVTLALEGRDALAPQLQALLRRLGDFVVVLLTQVVGRGLGLIGRGILQGMGRSVGRS